MSGFCSLFRIGEQEVQADWSVSRILVLQRLLRCTTKTYVRNHMRAIMMKMTSRLMFATAAAGLAFAPVAAQANTRAGDSGVVYSAPVSDPGAGRSAEGEEVIGSGFLAAILAAIAAAGVIIIIDDDDDQSPGT